MMSELKARIKERGGSVLSPAAVAVGAKGKGKTGKGMGIDASDRATMTGQFEDVDVASPKNASPSPKSPEVNMDIFEYVGG